MSPRFLSDAATAALASLVSGAVQSAAPAAPVPIPPSRSAIDLPADHYLHRTAPTEWWWNIGTLRAGERTFGFEINAASFEGQGGFAFSQVMLTDVSGNRSFQRTTPFLPPLLFDGNTWAEHDPTKDWSVRLGDPSNPLSAIEIVDPGTGYTSAPAVAITGGGGGLALALAAPPKDGKLTTIVLVSAGVGFTSEPAVTVTGGGGTGATARAVHSYVTMNAPWGEPTKNMAVKAYLVDEATQTVVTFDLSLSQQGAPFIVWGTGVRPIPGTSGGHLQTNNYYYSLTRLQASGTITIGGERFEVTGVTWMDHEYGAFTNQGKPVKWILQDMQLDNGVCISNFSIPDAEHPPKLNYKSPSQATVQRADGTLYFVPSFVTPIEKTWPSPATGNTYFMKLLVEIPSFDATITVTSLVDAQEFTSGPVYEGVASATGTFEGTAVAGDAWNEQAPG